MSLLKAITDKHQSLLIGLQPNDPSLHVEVIPGFEWARLGITQDAVLLLLPPETNRGAPDHDLEHIRISPHQRFIINGAQDAREEAVSVIATKSRDGWLVDVFLELVAMLFDSGVTSDEESVRKLIQDLVSLFRALTQPNQKSAQGLWGELFLILQATDTDLAVASWHTTPNDRYDFAKGHERVEVKTTTGPRIHMFSHAQLMPIDGLQVTIASLILNPSGEGATCADLVSQVLPKLGSEPTRRSFVNQVVRTLGENWNHQSGSRYDIEQATQSLRFYDVKNVPKITQDIPPNVHAVKYQSDLQVASEMQRSDLAPRDLLCIALYGDA
jgi:hypothetical protein